MKKKYTVIIKEAIHVNNHVCGHAKIVKTPSSKIKRKYGKEIYFGDDYKRSKQAWVLLWRVIDREKDRYREKIQTKAGKIITYICVPLSKHRGHGAAKFGKNTT